MTYAEKVEFVFRPPVMVGAKENGREVTKIQVYELEYDSHSETEVIWYEGNDQIGKSWGIPVIITYQSRQGVGR